MLGPVLFGYRYGCGVLTRVLPTYCIILETAQTPRPGLSTDILQRYHSAVLAGHWACLPTFATFVGPMDSGESPWRDPRARYPAVDTHAMKQYKPRIDPSMCSKDYSSFALDLLLRGLSLYAETELLNICSNLYMRFLRHMSIERILQAYSNSPLHGAAFLVTRAIAVATCTYCLLISIHNVITMVQMGLFLTRTRRVPPPEWMFPPMFGNKFNTSLPSQYHLSSKEHRQ